MYINRKMKRQFQKNIFKRMWTILLVSALYRAVSAQQGTTLTLEDAIMHALENNREVQMSKLDEQISLAKYRQSQAVFLPQVEVSYTALVTDNPLNAFGSKLQQERITSSDFNPDLLNHPSETYDFMTKLEVRQPILNIDRLYQRKAGLRQSELYRFKTLRTREYVIFEVQNAYLKLQFAWRALKVIDEALQTARSVYTFTGNRFEKGLLQKSDFLNAQVQVNTLETKRAEAKSGLQNASDDLGILMGKPSREPFEPAGNWSADTPGVITDAPLPETRADFMALQKAAEAANMSVISGKTSYLPRINAFASYQLNDKSPDGFNASSYVAGVQLSWNLFNGMQTHQLIAQRRFERDKLSTQLDQQKEQALLELLKTQRSIHDARLKIQQQKMAVEQSDEALRILRNRYEQGLINTTEILMAQSQLSRQQLAYEQAVLEMNAALAYHQFLTAAGENR
jgi:outer membrane protein TolC